MTKICSKCGMEKPFSAFSINNRRPDKKACWCKACLAASTHRRQQTSIGRAKVRESNWRTWGIQNRNGSQFTHADYDRAFIEQGGLCKLCDRSHTVLLSRLVADHDHATKFFRGLLCKRCNRRLSDVEGNSFTSRAKVYLTKES